VTFCFDRSIGRRVPDTLKLLGADVFKQTTSSTSAPPMTSGSWRPRSKAGRSSRRTNASASNEVERRAIRDARVGCFVLLSPKLTRWTMGRLLLQVWDRLEAIATSEPRPFIDGVHADGSVRPLRLR
jgi:hypothetical protein